MDGEDVRQRLVCLQNVARHYLQRLLMHFVSKYKHDCPTDPAGTRLSKLLVHCNNTTHMKILKEIKQDPLLPTSLVLYPDGMHFQNSIPIELLDITALCVIFNLDVDEFPLRKAEHRENGFYRLVCTQAGHFPGCCKKCNHVKGERCKVKKCGKTRTQCIEESAPCCNICNSCARCKRANSRPACDHENLREIVKKVRDLRNLAAHKTKEAFDNLRTSTFNDKRFPNCQDYVSLWSMCESHVTSLLDYLLKMSVISQKDYNKSTNEMMVIGRDYSAGELERIYIGTIQRERSKTVKFELEFGMNVTDDFVIINSSNFVNSNHFTEKDIDLHSNLSISVEEYVKTYFSTEHDIDNDSLKLTKVNKTGSNEWPMYKFIMKSSTTSEDEFMTKYKDCRSIASKELWENIQDIIQHKIAEKFSFVVEFRLCTWEVGSLIITISIGKSNGDWMEDEQLSLEQVMKSFVGFESPGFMCITSVVHVPRGKPNTITYTFQMNCSNSAVEGVSNVIEELRRIILDGAVPLVKVSGEEILNDVTKAISSILDTVEQKAAFDDVEEEKNNENRPTKAEINSTSTVFYRQSMVNSVLTIGAVGQKIELGMLWDGHHYCTLAGLSLWDASVIEKNQKIDEDIHTEFDLQVTDEERCKAHKLDAEASLSASIGLFKLEGSAKYLNQKKSSKHEAVITVTAAVRTQSRRIPQEVLASIGYANNLDLSHATHFVAEVAEGGSASMTFVSKAYSSEENQHIEGMLKASFQKACLKVEGEAKVELDDVDEERINSVSCKFAGDYKLEVDISNFRDAMTEAAQFPKRLSGVCNTLTVKLLPLEMLDSTKLRICRKLSDDVVMQTQKMIAKFHDVTLEADEVEKTSRIDPEISLFEILSEQVRNFHSALYRCKLKFTEAVFKLLPNIKRGDEADDKSLIELLAKAEQQCKTGMAFVKEKVAQFEVMRVYIKELVASGFEKKNTLPPRTQTMDLEKPGFLFDLSIMDEKEENHPLLMELDSSSPEKRKKKKNPWWHDSKVMLQIAQARQLVESNKFIGFESENWAAVKPGEDDDDKIEEAGDAGLIFSHRTKWIPWKEVPAVKNLKCTHKSSVDIDMQWESCDGADFYVLTASKCAEKEADKIPFYKHRISGGTSSHELRDLQPGTEYSFEVYACSNLHGAGVRSQQVVVTTDLSPSTTLMSEEATKQNKMPDDKQDKQDIILCGKPGLGKSTILTSISGMKFESGISWGSGLTSKLQFQCSDKDPNVRFADTPGLADVKMAEKAAEAITEALKDAAENNTTVKIFFVVSCEAGRVRPEDFLTINNVMGAINTPDGNKPGINTHGVIVNKCEFLDQPSFKEKGKDMVEKSFSTKSDMNKYPTLYIKFLPREEGLVNASNGKGNFDGLVEWMDTFPGLEVGSVDIIDVSKIEEKLEEMKKVHKKAMDDLEKKLKEDMERKMKAMERKRECLTKLHGHRAVGGHSIVLSIWNKTNHHMTYTTANFQCGRLGNGESWKNIPKNDNGTFLLHEGTVILNLLTNGLLTGGCSGEVQYTMKGHKIAIAFSNPPVGSNKIGVGPGDKIWNVWYGKTDHYDKWYTTSFMLGDISVMCRMKSTRGSTNNAEVEIYEQ